MFRHGEQRVRSCEQREGLGSLRRPQRREQLEWWGWGGRGKVMHETRGVNPSPPPQDHHHPTLPMGKMSSDILDSLPEATWLVNRSTWPDTGSL